MRKQNSDIISIFGFCFQAIIDSLIFTDEFTTKCDNKRSYFP